MIKPNPMIYGTMGLGGGWEQSKITQKDIDLARHAIDAALEIGIDTFDCADIYRKGRSEEVVGELIREDPELRKKIKIQSKVGIILPHEDGVGRYDFSYDHIIKQVQASLTRLKIEQMDTLLLHRPDPLMSREELRRSFSFLFDQGLIRAFGVSNMNQYQIEWVQEVLERKVVANQLEMSLKRLDWLDGTIGVNNDEGFKSTFTPGLMEYMNLQGIEVQAWSPLARGMYSGVALEKPNQAIAETQEYVSRLAKDKDTSPESIVIAFILKHPTKIRPVIGTTNRERILALRDAHMVQLSRYEWYQLYIRSRGGNLP